MENLGSLFKTPVISQQFGFLEEFEKHICKTFITMLNTYEI